LSIFRISVGIFAASAFKEGCGEKGKEGSRERKRGMRKKESED
jgi:hypothetical protein